MKKNLGVILSLLFIIAIGYSLYIIFSVEKEKIARTILLDANTIVTYFVDGKKYDTSIISDEIGKIEYPPKNPQKNGYTFQYWELNGKKFNMNSDVTKSISLIAVFQKNDSEVIIDEIQEIPFKEDNIQLTVGDQIDINNYIVSIDVRNMKYSITPENSDIVKIRGTNITGKNIGTTKVDIVTRDRKYQSSINITVIPTDKIINLESNKYQVYNNYKDITLKEDTRYRGIQNFAFSNFNQNNEHLYISTAYSSNIPISYFPNGNVDVNSKYFKDVQRTIIYKINNNRNIESKMYLELAGHGSSFDMEQKDDIIWVNDFGTMVSKDNNGYWAKSHGLMRIKYQEVPKNGSFNKLLSYKLIKDARYEASPEPCIDEDNNMIAIVIANHIKIFNLNDFKNEKINELYNFYIKPSDEVANLSRQGYALLNGYLYGLYGNSNQTPIIEVYKLNGYPVKKIHVKEGYTLQNDKEPEGIKIYNNQIFIGSTKVKGRSSNGTEIILNEIGYLK